MCATQERQIAMAIMGYADDNRGWHPMVTSSHGNMFRPTGAAHPGNIRGYFGVPLGKVPASAPATASLLVLLCPSRDANLNDRYVDYSQGGSTGTTYRIIAARGDRDREGDPMHSFTDSSYEGEDGKFNWYGWINKGYSGSALSPLPRQQMLDGHSPADYPMLSDAYNAFGNVTSLYGANHYSEDGTSSVLNNHESSVNTAFADGHVKRIRQDNFTKFVKFYSSDNYSRVWW